MNINRIIATGIANMDDNTGKYVMVFQFYEDGTITSIAPGIEREHSLYEGLPVLLDDLHIIDPKIFYTFFERWDD